MFKSSNKKKLTLDDVLQRLQAESGMAAVANAGQIKGGAVERPIYDECHKVKPA
jgi:hypothetical protein